MIETCADNGVENVRVCCTPSGTPAVERNVLEDVFRPGIRSTYVTPGCSPASEKSSRVGHVGWNTTVCASRRRNTPVAGTFAVERMLIVFALTVVKSIGSVNV